MLLAPQEVALELPEKGYFRLSAFNSRENVEKAMKRIVKFNAHLMVSSLLKCLFILDSLIMVDSANQTDGDTAVIDQRSSAS